MKDESFGNERFLLQLYGAFADVALFLAAVGIYGLLAFSVSQRAREIGVRMALGADQFHVIGMIVREAMVLASTGLALGFVVAAIVG
jgi:putative ABC transport system permease protein